MQMTSDLIIIIVIINLFFIYWIWDEGIRKIILNQYRHELFMLRHNLLLFAAKNNVMLTSSSYTQIRDIINNNIRFAHKLNYVYFIFMLYNLRKHSGLLAEAQNEILSVIKSEKNEEIRESYSKYLERLTYINYKYLVISSPIVWVKISSKIFVMLLKNFGISLNESFKKVIKNYQTSNPVFYEIVYMEKEIERCNFIFG